LLILYKDKAKCDFRFFLGLKMLRLWNMLKKIRKQGELISGFCAVIIILSPVSFFFQKNALHSGKYFKV